MYAGNKTILYPIAPMGASPDNQSFVIIQEKSEKRDNVVTTTIFHANSTLIFLLDPLLLNQVVLLRLGVPGSISKAFKTF